jgi:hypothetical protein
VKDVETTEDATHTLVIDLFKTDRTLDCVILLVNHPDEDLLDFIVSQRWEDFVNVVLIG